MEADATLWRNIGKWTIGFFLFLVLSATFVSLMLLQLTAEGSSKRTLRRSVAAITEIDRLLDRHYDEMQQRARASKTGDGVQLDGFPIAITFTPAEINGASKQQIRNMILDRAADALYRHGSGRLRDSAARGGSVGRFSLGGLTEHGLGFLRGRVHDILLITTIVLAVLCGVLAGALALTCRGFGRLGAIGGTVLIASVPLVTFGIGARFYMRILTDGDKGFIEREFLEIGQALAWIPIRDGLALMVFGIVCVVTALAAARWSDGRLASQAAYARAHPRVG